MIRTLSAAVLALSLGAAAHPVFAVQDPVSGRFDTRVRIVAYNPMNPVRIIGSTFTSTQIMFAVGETITHVAIGDSDAWMPSPTGNLLFLKPIEVRAPTNMQVVTAKPDGSIRSYQFELIARAQPANGSAQVASLDGTVPLPAAVTPFAIQFIYPGDAREAAIAARQKALLGADEKLAESRLAVDYFYGPRNWRYTAQGSTAIEPTEVSDNGRLTAMRFPGNSTIPTIYAIGPDGQETIVPYTMKADVVVVSTTAREFRLRYGIEVLRIINNGFNAVGMNPQTGTTSPEVVRTIRKAGP